jgi:hypothetical protein
MPAIVDSFASFLRNSRTTTLATDAVTLHSRLHVADREVIRLRRWRARRNVVDQVLGITLTAEIFQLAIQSAHGSASRAVARLGIHRSSRCQGHRREKPSRK